MTRVTYRGKRRSQPEHKPLDTGTVLATTGGDLRTETSVPNAFSVDVEDYFQVSGFEDNVSRERWGEFECRVERNTYRILKLLARHDTLATFFVLGWVADRFPQLIREIHAAGHEIGSHTYWHHLIYQQSKDEFRSDLRRSRDVLQDVLGEPVTSFRAPSFSITKRSEWSLEVLVEEGFTVDSSIVPARHDRYGMPGAPRVIHHIETPAGSICEFPPTVVQFAKYNLPVGGGGYFRLYPFAFSRRWLAKARAQTRQPFMFYIHPWEVDPEQPRMRCSKTARFRHYVGLRNTECKLEKLLQSFSFSSVSNVLNQVQPTQPPTTCLA